MKKNNYWKLFIDDLRNPADDSFVVVRTTAEAITLMEAQGCPNFIAFDHDLGGDDRAIDVVKWLCNKDLDLDGKFIPKDFTYVVHSSNPWGQVNIASYLDSYLNGRNC